MQTKLIIVLPLCISLAFAGKARAQTPTGTPTTPTAAGQHYTFTEGNLSSMNPCLTCVSFASSKEYKSGNIAWSGCTAGSTAKKYLNFRLTYGGQDLRARLLRDCRNPAHIQVIRCPHTGSAELNWVAFNNSVAFASGAGGQILLVKIRADNTVEIELKAGWKLYYDQQLCAN